MKRPSLPAEMDCAVACAIFNTSFPPEKNSGNDIALLRAANIALLRKSKEATDKYLFVFVGNYDFNTVGNALEVYGFPNVEVVIAKNDADPDRQFDYDEMRSIAGSAIDDWVRQQHPTAIPFVAAELDADLFWWVGIELRESSYGWCFDSPRFASELPVSHRARADSWLAVLDLALELHELGNELRDDLNADEHAVIASTLCEWLHGFEAASGNNFNGFDASSVATSLGFSEFFLGFELSRLRSDTLAEICEEEGMDVGELCGVALSELTKENRSRLRSALSNFFGGDVYLLWSLYSSIWPEISKPMNEAIGELTNPSDEEDMETVDKLWRFVREGWCDESDDW